MTNYTDAEERDALLEGVAALRLRSRLLKQLSQDKRLPHDKTQLARWKAAADVLEEMAACYV